VGCIGLNIPEVNLYWPDFNLSLLWHSQQNFNLAVMGFTLQKNIIPDLVELANPVHLLAQVGHAWQIQINTYMTGFLYA
jgi:hypothetical protein